MTSLLVIRLMSGQSSTILFGEMFRSSQIIFDTGNICGLVSQWKYQKIGKGICYRKWAMSVLIHRKFEKCSTGSRNYAHSKENLILLFKLYVRFSKKWPCEPSEAIAFFEICNVSKILKFSLRCREILKEVFDLWNHEKSDSEVKIARTLLRTRSANHGLV